MKSQTQTKKVSFIIFVKTLVSRLNEISHTSLLSELAPNKSPPGNEIEEI